MWAIACTAFFGFFQLGQLLPDTTNSFDPATGVIWGDVSVDSHSAPAMFQIHLKKSKCDQFGAGSDIVLGATGSEIWPVKAIISYIGLRGSRPGAFFIDSAHKAVSNSWFTAQIREILNAIGLPQHQYNIQDTVSVLGQQLQPRWSEMKIP